jgi:hypothetical protein
MVEPMSAFVIPAIVVAVVVGVAFAIGFGPIVFVLVGLAVLFAIGWFFVAGAARRTPREAVQRAEKEEFLGPGGPDDPTR